MEPPQEQQRTSGGSGRSSGGGSNKSSRSQNPQQQLSTIEKSVTHLLVATKQLLETLTQWSRGSATEGEVSDVYVRLGYEFNIACRAFGAIGVDTSDLGPVPDLLRSILEDTLSQEATQASLDKYLPRIRDIIINLLHGLKKKQQRLRSKGGHGTGGDGRPPRQASTASNLSAESSLTQQLDAMPSRQSSSRSFAQRHGSADVAMPDLPPRTTSAGRHSPKKSADTASHHSAHPAPSRDTAGSENSSLSSNAMEDMPVIAPYPEHDTIPTNQQFEQSHPPPTAPPPPEPPEPPRPPPKQNDALSALQRGGDLERRASRRFSAYHLQKQLGTSINGIGAMPAAQHSPVPNRGRDARESLNAVRSRGSQLHSRARSRNQAAGYEPSPNSKANEVRRISEETGDQSHELPQPPRKPFAEEGAPESPNIKTPEDKLASSYAFPETPRSPEKFSATVNGPVDEHFVPGNEPAQPQRRRSTRPSARSTPRKTVVEEQQRSSPQAQYVPESSPQPGKELTLFLQYKSKIKKFVLSDGADLSVARLQLAFIEKFQWNTQDNGADLPEIYIQDPVSGVRHELEDLADIKDRSVLVLNIEALDEVKRHFDDGLGGLKTIVEGIKASVEGQQSAIQLVSDRQQESAKEIANMTVATPATRASSTTTATSTTPTRPVSAKDKAGQLDELQKLRRDLAVVRQTYTSFVADMNTSMTTIRTKAATVKKAAADTTVPEMDPTTGRAYVDRGKKTLSADSEHIVDKVDTLQDMVEELRKDVVTRGVRPRPADLESVGKDIGGATAALKKLQEFLKREKPVWTKIWERELQVVCDDRDLLTLQEELAVDLEDDLEKAAATFALVEQATKQQNLHKPDPAAPNAAAAAAGGLRSTSRGVLPIAMDQGADPHKAKDGVLGEVRALQPNHESRLEAIERAERNRRRELESRRGGEFQQELGCFVEEGKLKKTGGVEEVERVRKVREERARQEVLDRQAQRMREAAEKREREAEEAARAEAGGEGENGDGDGNDGGENGAAADGAAAGEDTDGNVVPGEGAGESAAPAATAADALEVPAKGGPEGERGSSPEPGFVDAKEDVSGAPTPATESGSGPGP